MSILNDIEKVRRIDPSNMYNRIFDLPEQMEDALKIARKWDVDSASFPDVRNIVLIGMGGSAIGGELARSYLARQLLVPFTIYRHYELPEFVDDESLVIASSYSGNTEETLAALDDAVDRSAMIAAITTGGMLADVAKVNEIPTCIIPAGHQPRAAIGYSFVPIMMFLDKIGLIKDAEAALTRTIEQLKKLRERYIEGSEMDENPAKIMAEGLYGTFPIIYSGPTLTDVAAMRWKAQICENSKNLAFVNHFPEMNHNELVGWSKMIEPYREYLAVVMLRDVDDHPRIKRRLDLVGDILAKAKVTVHEIESEGDDPLSRIFSLIQMGDFVSYYMAILNEFDPTPVEVIENLKKELARTE